MRVAWLKDLRMADLERVGGKNASLGEMMNALAATGIRVPGDIRAVDVKPLGEWYCSRPLRV